MPILKEIRKKRRGGPKTPPAVMAAACAGILVLVCVSAYALYSLIDVAPTSKTPVFETIPTHGIEANVKHIDRRISDALLDLGVPPDDVVFNTVETRCDGDERWTYSNLEVCVRKRYPKGRLKAVFSRHLSGAIPGTSLQFSSGPKREPVLELSVNGHPTHRLVFIRAADKKPTHPTQGLPLVAIIIDDLGYDHAIASGFLQLDSGLSFSILPHSPFQHQIASALHRTGRDVLLHLPMEPLKYAEADPGRGALTTSMGPDELLNQLKKDLDAVPFIVGVNNHMGSRLTQDSARMRQIFTLLKRRNLFFIDSLTSSKSRCSHAARLLKLKFSQRDVFLDHHQDEGAIRFQIKRLITVAKTRGKAIGIAHPYPITLETLKKELPKIKRQVKIVPVSQLVG